MLLYILIYSFGNTTLPDREPLEVSKKPLHFHRLADIVFSSRLHCLRMRAVYFRLLITTATSNVKVYLHSSSQEMSPYNTLSHQGWTSLD